MRERPRWKTQVIKGDPIAIGQRQLVPVVKVRSTIRRHVTFGTDASSGGGGGLVWIQPVAIIERQLDGNEERIPIPDETSAAIKGILTGIIALPMLYLVIAFLAHLWRHKPNTE